MEAVANVGRGVGGEKTLQLGHVLGRAVGCCELAGERIQFDSDCVQLVEALADQAATP